MSISDDKKRFTDIYNEESDSLFRFCLLRVSNRDKALDITQESFTRFWNSIYQGKQVDNPRALLFVVARNLIIDWYRRIKSSSLESLTKDDDDRTFDFPDEVSTSQMDISADSKRVLSMLNNLEKQYREVVYLRYVEDLPPKDIAQILHLNTNVVSVRITRGMEALRKMMGIKKNGSTGHSTQRVSDSMSSP